MLTTIPSLAIPALACAFLATLPSQVVADYTVKADAGTTILDNWEGWGTSLCWWANAFGDRKDIADVFFTLQESVTLEGGPSGLPGLGLNVVRYNIGGSSKNVIDDGGTKVAMKLSPSMPAFKFIESFWINWLSNDSDSKSWDWNADLNQRTMLNLAIKRGVDVTEAFSNSPPWWMTHNYATAGGDDGRKDNLKSWNHNAFAFYLAYVVKHAKHKWGVSFDYVEAFNEPMSIWWKFPKGQEGCRFNVDSQISVLLKLRRHLDDLGMNNVVIATFDENTPSLALSTLRSMSSKPDVLATFGKVNTHGYEGLSPYRGPDRKPLKDLVTKLDKKLWDSEYGEKDGTGLSMAESIPLDINVMGISAFVYWQVLDGGGWGLIQASPADKTLGVVNTKFYVLAQYTRHIRPGMTILSTSDLQHTVVAHDAKSNLLVLVTVNSGKAASTVTFDLSSFQSVKGPISTWMTETSGSGALYKPSTIELSGTSFSASIPAESVMTFEIQECS
ncbi:hypothetical protein DD238_000831 [Peronospora effusa]|uniref:Endo-beta-1,6-galactanase-like domain-containing protein n=1 Tax=Peronospora effusa TaxID=542832 RepID=A0A3M6V8G2_9STRA|nr:hypothetical protein DD238_000831 [Peronospora effusa]